MSEDVRVEDNPEASRYEVFVDDELAGFAEYHDALGIRTLHHTVVAPEFGGRGVGGKLAAAALDDVRAKGLAVVPTCPFIASYIQRNPDYADLVRTR